MSGRDHLEQNIKNLLQRAEPQLRLGQQRKRAILDRLKSEAQVLSSPRSRGKLHTRRFAIAATMIVATLALVVVLGLLTNKTAALAYAIEDTITALQKVRTIHVVGTNWDDERFESWCIINPETGKAESVCIDETPYGNKVSSTLKGSCVWDASGNIVNLTNRIIATNDLRYGYIFEELSKRMADPRDGEIITIYEQGDPGGDGEAIVIKVSNNLQDYTIYIDPATKLPTRMRYDRADNMQQICKTIDQIEYDVTVPKGMFDFEVPADRIRDYSALDDPKNGMSAEGLTHQQASRIICESYWKAAIAADWETFRRLAPMDRSWKTGYRTNPPVEIIEIKQPYLQRGSSGMLAPAVIRYEDGKVLEHTHVVNWREIDGEPSCIIVAFWGKARLVE